MCWIGQSWNRGSGPGFTLELEEMASIRRQLSSILEVQQQLHGTLRQVSSALENPTEGRPTSDA